MTRTRHLAAPGDASVGRRRWTVLLTGAFLLLVGCTGGARGPTDAVAEATGQAVASVDEVATAQADADAQLREVLAELRAGDETVRRLRAAASAAGALDGSAEVRRSLDELDLAVTEEAFERLGRATARARDDVATASAAARHSMATVLKAAPGSASQVSAMPSTRRSSAPPICSSTVIRLRP